MGRGKSRTGLGGEGKPNKGKIQPQVWQQLYQQQLMKAKPGDLDVWLLPPLSEVSSTTNNNQKYYLQQ